MFIYNFPDSINVALKVAQVSKILGKVIPKISDS